MSDCMSAQAVCLYVYDLPACMSGCPSVCLHSCLSSKDCNKSTADQKSVTKVANSDSISCRCPWHRIPIAAAADVPDPLVVVFGYTSKDKRGAIESETSFKINLFSFTVRLFLISNSNRVAELIWLTNTC